MPWPVFSLRTLQPRLYMAAQQPEWHGAVFQHPVMKFANVEILAKRLLGFAAQRNNLQRARIVRSQLPRQNGNTVDHLVELLRRETSRLTHESARFVTRPAHQMQAGIDDHAPCRPSAPRNQ